MYCQVRPTRSIFENAASHNVFRASRRQLMKNVGQIGGVCYTFFERKMLPPLMNHSAGDNVRAWSFDRWLAVGPLIAAVLLAGTASAAIRDHSVEVARPITGPLLVGLGVGGALVVIAAVVSLLWMRFTHRVGRLLERIEELQVRDKEAVLESAERSSIIEKNLKFRPHATADVLAGRTEEVDSIVNGSGDAKSLIEQTILSTHEGLSRNLSPKELAGKLNVSLRTLQRNLSATLNCTPRELILSLKMREAYRLLWSDRYNVTEVAMELGFSSSSHFSRRFKTFYKQSPINVIRSAREAHLKIP
jgi:AraC-like DNA-binding protein